MGIKACAAIRLCSRISVFSVMRQPIQNGRCKCTVIIEDFSSVFERPVGRDNGRIMFVAPADDLKQAIRPELVNRKVAQLVNYQKRWLQILLHLTFHAARHLRPAGLPGAGLHLDGHGRRGANRPETGFFVLLSHGRHFQMER